MPNPLVECVPNFSEGRRPEVVIAIEKAISSVNEVRVLDRHSDMDHNRTVITFVGPPKAVEEAAFRGISRAADLINLDHHTGEHPRIGATDVVPFVPLLDVSMQECVAIAQRLGERVGTELGIPVYLYEQAATRPDRQNLEDIRRGEYENLKLEIINNLDRKPDFGPSKLGPAGATVIGARPFLIAYNVYLTTSDVSIAEKIARTIRNSSGGFRYVKALGLDINGQAQVSMNLTNFQKTPIARVVELIRREAVRYGVAIHHSELVGLIPQDALINAAVWYLQLDQFETDQVLEKKLYQPEPSGEVAPLTESSSEVLVDTRFLEALSSGAATPGGGSASAYAGAMSAALVAMVAQLTLGKKKYLAVEEKMRVIHAQASALQQELLQSVSEDAKAFNNVMAAYRLSKVTPDEINARNKAIRNALLEAARVPMQVAQGSVRIMELALVVVNEGNPNALSDSGSAAALAKAAFTGAGLNVRINLRELGHDEVNMKLLEQLQQLEETANRLEKEIKQAIHMRGGLDSAQ
jgi:glutamate formiminotransferase / formiminotetrahydrofolate cyclodeaminase